VRAAASALALSALLAVVAQAPAATVQQHRYTVVTASGSERVEFSNGQGVNGVVTYRFRGRPLRGRAIVSARNGRTIGVTAKFRTDGRTIASVQGCSDVVHHRVDGFELFGVSGRSKLDFLLHPNSPFTSDYLRTRCPGPLERDLLDADAVPTASFAAGGFTGSRIRFSITGAKSFRGVGGWSGTTTWRVVYKLAEQSGRVRPATARGRA
jgi:hypothetical protein